MPLDDADLARFLAEAALMEPHADRPSYAAKFIRELVAEVRRLNADSGRLDWLQTLDLEDFSVLPDAFWEQGWKDIRKAIDSMKMEMEGARAEVEPFES